MLKKNILYILPFFAFVLFIFPSCDLITPPQSKEPRANVSELLSVDKEFSDMSSHIGMKKAYLEYMSDEGTLLRPGYLPITGADAINYLSLVADEGYELSWEPTDGMISSSGDLGFTYGTYRLKTADITYEGTYTNIWKKEAGGRWKYVLNSSNEGISLNQ
jgi:ketosteroid isomerase-like protein